MPLLNEGTDRERGEAVLSLKPFVEPNEHIREILSTQPQGKESKFMRPKDERFGDHTWPSLCVIFPKKWPRLRSITWPLAKARSHFRASTQRSKLKHKVPKVRFVHHNVAVS